MKNQGRVEHEKEVIKLMIEMFNVNVQNIFIHSESCAREKPKFSRIRKYTSRWLDEDSMHRDHI